MNQAILERLEKEAVDEQWNRYYEEIDKKKNEEVV